METPQINERRSVALRKLDKQQFGMIGAKTNEWFAVPPRWQKHDLPTSGGALEREG